MKIRIKFYDGNGGDKSISISTIITLDSNGIPHSALWLSREDGEGQGMSEDTFYKFLDKFFTENM